MRITGYRRKKWICLLLTVIVHVVLDWFVSYMCLSKRKQWVVLKTGETSLFMPCESGVPQLTSAQGRVLGPLLISLHHRLRV